MFRNILVAVDGSTAATEALEEAINLARRTGGRLTLLSVATPPRFVAASVYVVPFATEDELERDAEEIVDRAATLVPDDVPVCTLVRHGPAAKAILERVEHAEHDLVVVGVRHHRLAGPLRLGSVSSAVLARSRVPVLVHPAGALGLREPVKATRESG